MAKKQQGHPAKAPRRGKEVSRTPKDQLAADTLEAYKTSTDLVRQSEALIIQAYRDGEDPSDLADAHLQLRSSALGLLVLYSKLTGLPDPRDGILAGDTQYEVPAS